MHSLADYTSAFVRKGKTRPFAMLEKDAEAQMAFAQMASGKISDASIEILKKFTAKMYGAKDNCKSSLNLNDHRYRVFEKSFGPKASPHHPLHNIKGIAGSAIPPCEAELVPKIQRSAFIARMWAQADNTDINQHPTTDDGWQLENDSYQITWFTGSQLPEKLIPEDEDDSDDETSYEEDTAVSSDEDTLSVDEDDYEVGSDHDNI